MSELQTRLQEHAHRAYILAQIETRPPGYGVNEWACLLMDNPCDKLRDRYEKRVQREAEKATEIDRMDPLFPGLLLPAVPTHPSPALAAKAGVLYESWLVDLVQSECNGALQVLVGQKRSVSVLLSAQELIRGVLARLGDEEGPLPFQVKVTMNKDRTFTLNLTRPDSRRRQGR